LVIERGISGVLLGAQCATVGGFRLGGGVLLAFVPRPLTGESNETRPLLGRQG
jgi:hypothetical protein